jgi:hypothetical protein
MGRMVREIRLPAVYIFTGLRWEILIRAKECSFEIMGLSETFLKKNGRLKVVAPDLCVGR